MCVRAWRTEPGRRSHTCSSWQVLLLGISHHSAHTLPQPFHLFIIYLFCCCSFFLKIATNLQLGRIFSTARMSFPVEVNISVFFLFLNSRSAVIGGFVSLNCWVERLIQQLCFRVLLPLERRTEWRVVVSHWPAQSWGSGNTGPYCWA